MITLARKAMAVLLGDALEVQAHAFMPERLVPPAAVILPGSPYLTAGATFGTFTLNLELILTAAARVNEVGTEALDALIEDAIVELVNSNISVTNVSEFWKLTIGNAEHLATTITTSQPISL